MGVSVERFAFAEFQFDPTLGRLVRQRQGYEGEAVPLGSRAAEVLRVLLEHRGEVVAKADIMRAVWPSTVVSDANLAVQMSALRNAIGQKRSGTGLIQTLPGRGYRFAGPVTRLATQSGLAAPVGEHGRGGQRAVQLPRSPAERFWVGRETILAGIGNLMAQARGGERHVAFVTGEAGAGKTTLVDMAVRRLVTEDIGLLKAGCTELLGSGEAFLPLIEAVYEAVNGPGRDVVLRALRTHAPTWLAQFPDALDPQDRATFLDEVRGATRARMLREFCNLMEALAADRPWLLVLEDLHWADPATVDAIVHLARRTRRSALLVLATYRPADGGQPSSILAAHGDLRIHNLCSQWPLPRLSRAEVGRYLSLRLEGAPWAGSIADRVFDRTEGHPLFVAALVDDLARRGSTAGGDGTWPCGKVDDLLGDNHIPLTARDVITQQVGRLPSGIRCLLEIASAAGETFSAAVLAGAAGMGVVDVEAALQAPADRQHVIAADGVADHPDGTCSARYRFVHTLYREVLYAQITPARKVATHAQLGETIERAFRNHRHDAAPILAFHFERGRDVARAIAYLVLAASSSARRFADLEAAQYLTRAIAIAELCPGDTTAAHIYELLRRRAWFRRSAGDMAGAVADLERAVAQAAEADDTHAEIASLMDLSRFSLFGDRRQCLITAGRASSLCRSLGETRFATLTLASAASTRMLLQGWNPADACLCERAMQLNSGPFDIHDSTRLSMVAGTLAYLRGDYQTCRTAAIQAKQFAQALGDSFLFALNNVMGSHANLHLGRFGEVKADGAAVLAIAERNCNPAASALGHLTMARCEVALQEFDQAVQRCRSIPEVSFTDNPFIHSFRQMVLAVALAGAGDARQAEPYFVGLTAIVESHRDVLDYPLLAEIYACLASYRLAAGTWNAARRWATHLQALASPAPDRHYLGLAYRLFAEISLAEGLVPSAEAALHKAFAMIEGQGFVVAEWQTSQTAVAFHQRHGSNLSLLDAERGLVRASDRMAPVADGADCLPMRQILNANYVRVPTS